MQFYDGIKIKIIYKIGFLWKYSNHQAKQTFHTLNKKIKSRFDSLINESFFSKGVLSLDNSSHFLLDTLNSNKIISEFSLNF